MTIPLPAGDWSRVRRVFEAALAEPAGRRPAFVEDSCRDELLASHDQAGGFLETPAAKLLDQTSRADFAADAGPDPNVGRTIGS